MKIDLLHNKIIAETATESFKSALSDAIGTSLAPKYGEGASFQMYEDHLSSGFLEGKTFHYPLSVKTEDGVCAEWVSWTMKRGAHSGDNPFAYVGSSPLEFTFGAAPEAIRAKLGSVGYFDEKTVKLRVETTVPDITILSGKYSQKFIDLLASRLGGIIEGAAQVSGLEESSVEIAVVFAPDTYMEHTSENVTYRRLLLVDKSSAPRDFWIKWTRLDGAGAYSIADDVNPDNILFELGEDVPQKIKEKEYRFLTRAGKDKYHNAMGRKHVTEWRDVLKRAAKRGELVRTAEPVARVSAAKAPLELGDQTPVAGGNAAEVAFELGVEAPVASVGTAEEALELGVRAPVAEPAPERAPAMSTSGVFSGATVIGEDGFTPESSDDELDRVMEMARLALNSVKDEEDDEEELDELESFYAEDSSPEAARRTEKRDEDEERELDEIARMALESLALMREQALRDDEAAETVEDEAELAEVALAEEHELMDEVEEASPEALLDVLAEEDEIPSPTSEEQEALSALMAARADEAALVSFDEGVVVVPEDPTEEEYIDDDVDELCDDELYDEEAESTLRDVRALEPDEEPEEAPKESAPAVDIEKLKEELEAKIRLEYESRARQRAEEEAARLRREQEQLRMENERLQQMARREQTERERAEENRKTETEQLRAQIEAQLRREAKEKERIAEAARIAVEEQQKLELEKLRAERMRLEDERVRREEEKRIEAERIAEEERLAAREAEARAKEEAKPSEAPAVNMNYTFTRKTVSLLFRKSVDPNLITRIHATIQATLEYLGKQNVPMKIKATIPSSNMVKLDFIEFPKEEMELLGSIIKILGNNNLGIAKAMID